MLEQRVMDVEKHGAGRPDKVTPEQKLEIYKAFEKYVDEEDYPTVTGFCARHKVGIKYKLISQNLKDWDQFSSLIKRANDKQAEFTEDMAQRGKMNPTWAIFKLKQPAFGWTDKQEVQHSGEVTNKHEYNIVAAQEFEQFLKRKDAAIEPGD
jgi:hypothetical protein